MQTRTRAYLAACVHGPTLSKEVENVLLRLQLRRHFLRRVMHTFVGLPYTSIKHPAYGKVV
jgi:hypothetical protein